MKKIYLFILLFTFFGFAQNARKIDSLIKVIISSPSDSLKSYKYYEISNLQDNKDSIISSLNKSLACARKAKNYKMVSAARAAIGTWKSKFLSREQAIKEHLGAVQELQKVNFKIGIANHYLRLGRYYTFFDNKKDSASYFTNKGIELADDLKDENLQVTACQALATIHYTNSDFDKALEQYIKAEKICSNSKLLNNSIKHGLCLQAIGDMMLRISKPKNALESFLRSKEIILKFGNKTMLNELNLSIIDSYIFLKQFSKALPLLNECESNSVSSKMDVTKTAIMYSNKGLCLENLGKPTDAEIYYKKAIEVCRIVKNNPTLISSIIYLADYYLKSEQYLLAETSYLEAEKIYKDSKENENDKLTAIYKGLTKINEKQKNYEKAIFYSNKTAEIEKIQKDKNIDSTILELEAKYQTEKKANEIKLLASENEILNFKNQLALKQTYIFIGILSLILFAAGFIFYGYRNKIKTAQKLQELNELKSRFFANISHEFRTPLTLIKSPVQSLKSKNNDQNQLKELDLIDNNSNRMLELVDQLLELSKIDSGNLKLILKEGNVNSFLHSIIEPFEFQAKENNLNFVSNIEKNIQNHSFDKDVIQKITTNLLSNAFKYTSENETIKFDSKITNQELTLKISNSGTEIKKEDLPRLFERFYQKKENSQGVGIGLALVKELVDLYQGKIETSLENGILSFTVILSLQTVNSNAILLPKLNTNEIISNEIDNDNELPILLIVDDNAEIRSVIAAIFKDSYTILEAEDGEMGLKIAQKEIPDCIISDLMMPKMDGFEFTKGIKNNELTSFIPIILLTAKTNDEAHLQGLKSESDAFLTKPFNNEIVKQTVNQLITERKKLQKRYSQELVLRPVDILINSVDEKFIEKLQVVLDKEMSNSEFSSDNFASSVGMSRMQLHRKLKSLLGVLATEFLRNERLKTAIVLLEKGNGTISEIAYSVGFNDVSYFSKCFKEVYNVTPTEYSNNKNTL